MFRVSDTWAMSSVAESIAAKSGIALALDDERHDDHDGVSARNRLGVLARCAQPTGADGRGQRSRSSTSPRNGSTPVLTRSTVPTLISSPTTSWPEPANCTARGKPILPRAITHIFTSKLPLTVDQTGTEPP